MTRRRGLTRDKCHLVTSQPHAAGPVTGQSSALAAWLLLKVCSQPRLRNCPSAALSVTGNHGDGSVRGPSNLEDGVIQLRKKICGCPGGSLDDTLCHKCPVGGYTFSLSPR